MTMHKELNVFISYAREDADRVQNLYVQLSSAGLKPWMDIKDILPGENWESSIWRAAQNADFVLVCLSEKSVNKRGFLQREIKKAMTIWEEKLEEDIYLIPVRLEKCDVPEILSRLQWVDLFEIGGMQKLLQAIQKGAERLGLEFDAKLPLLSAKTFSELVGILISCFTSEELKMLCYDTNFPVEFINWNQALIYICRNVVEVALEKKKLHSLLERAIQERPQREDLRLVISNTLTEIPIEDE